MRKMEELLDLVWPRIYAQSCVAFKPLQVYVALHLPPGMRILEALRLVAWRKTTHKNRNKG